MGALTAFQDDFARALLAAPGGAPFAAIFEQPGFAVYRNTVIKSCVDALQANYPAVARLTGDAWFHAAAATYARETPPDDPSMLKYGASFPAFLLRFEPARDMPWLAGVARLDRLWMEAHTARDDTVLDPATIATLPAKKLAGAVLYPHAAARWAWFADAPVVSMWSRNRFGDFADDEPWAPTWKAEGALLTRAQGHVEWIALNAAAFAFLEQCASGGTLAQAAQAAQAAQHDADFQQLMATLLRAGAFSRLSMTSVRRWHN
jgi:Putative DNA-binding domain